MDLNKAPQGMVLKFSAPDIGFRFEWVPDKQSVYSIKDGAADAIQIAAKIATPEAAHIVATVWTRGYREAKRDLSRAPGARHFHMLAEGGEIGARFGG